MTTKSARAAEILFEILMEADEIQRRELEEVIASIPGMTLRSIKRQPFAAAIINAIGEAKAYHEDMNTL